MPAPGVARPVSGSDFVRSQSRPQQQGKAATSGRPVANRGRARL